MRNIVLVTDLGTFRRFPGIHARSLVAALLISNSVRRDSSISMLFLEGFYLRFLGPSIRHLRPDEASALGIIERGIRWAREGRSGLPHWGLVVSRGDVEDLVKRLSGADCRYMVINGLRQGPPREFIGCSGYVFVIPVIDELPSHLARALEGLGYEKLKIPNYLPEQRIVILHYLLDNLTTTPQQP